MNEFDQSILLLLKLNGDSNPDIWNTCAVLYQLSYHPNWELVFMWVDEILSARKILVLTSSVSAPTSL